MSVLQNESLCPHEVHLLKPNPQPDGTRKAARPHPRERKPCPREGPPGSTLVPSALRGPGREAAACEAGSRLSPDAVCASTLILAFQPPEP